MSDLYKIIYELKKINTLESTYLSASTVIKKDWPPTKLEVENELRNMHPEMDIRVINYFPVSNDN